jgi:hypothetical protein
MTDPHKILQQMLDLNMLAREEDGTITNVSPRLWRWRDRLGDKEWQKMRKRTMRQEDAEARKKFKALKKNFVKALGEAVEAASNRPKLEEVAEIASVLIEGRAAFRAISSEEAFAEYWALEEQLKEWRVEALKLALLYPKMEFWGEFLFNAGAWQTEEEFEEELTALEDEFREAQAAPLWAQVVRPLTREDIAQLS